MHRPIHGLVAIATLLLPCMGFAQSLEPTSWEEHIILQVGPERQEKAGMDPDQPEAITDSLSVSGWGASGSLGYGPPGPPQLTSHAFGKRTNPYVPPTPAAYDSIAQAQGTVTFQFVVQTIATPPVPVTEVPVLMGAQGTTIIRGTAHASGCYPSTCIDGDPAAVAEILITDSYSTLVHRTITSAGPIPNDRTLNLSETHQIAPDIVINGLIQALSLIRMKFFDPGQWAEAKSTISPEFAISSDFIPGTESKYSDYFQIEYSPGYWALGNPSPVNPTTWGKIKSLYSKP